MHADVWNRFAEIVRDLDVRPERALEVGGRPDETSLLLFPELSGAERFCVNLEDDLPDAHGIRYVQANANRMDMFEPDTFDLVVSNATLEHDRFFWRSVDEMRRVLKPGGWLLIGVPGFVERPDPEVLRLPPDATLTYRLHMDEDYWRFSRKAVRSILLQGMRRVRVENIMTPPRIIGCGRKPRRAELTPLAG